MAESYPVLLVQSNVRLNMVSGESGVDTALNADVT